MAIRSYVARSTAPPRRRSTRSGARVIPSQTTSISLASASVSGRASCLQATHQNGTPAMTARCSPSLDDHSIGLRDAERLALFRPEGREIDPLGEGAGRQIRRLAAVD